MRKIKNYRNQDLKGSYKDFWTKANKKKIRPQKAKGTFQSSLTELGHSLGLRPKLAPAHSLLGLSPEGKV